MKFNSRKGIVVMALLPLLATLAVVSFLDKGYAVFAMLTICILYLGWMWFDTYYLIEGDQLNYKSALIKGSINIDAINSIVKNQTMYSGIKPALALRGIVIKYNK